MEKNHYYAIIRPSRKDFMVNFSKEDERLMSEHFAYLKDLLEKGKLYLAGPTLIEDDPFGLYIFETETEEEARKLLEADPSVVAGIQLIDDFRPIRISLSKLN